MTHRGGAVSCSSRGPGDVQGLLEDGQEGDIERARERARERAGEREQERERERETVMLNVL